MRRVSRMESGTINGNLKSMGKYLDSHCRDENKESIPNELKDTGESVKALLITLATMV